MFKKWLICSWFHKKWRCYPDVSGKGLKGVWHCMVCNPCGEGVLASLDEGNEVVGAEHKICESKPGVIDSDGGYFGTVGGYFKASGKTKPDIFKQTHEKIA